MSSSQEWTSLREFARRCGRRHRAAQKAIEDGRIPASAVKRNARGRIVAIEIYEARRGWMQYLDPARNPVPLREFPAAASETAPYSELGLDKLSDPLGRVLGVAFANALIPACAMTVARHQLDPARALEILEDFLLVMMFAVADALGFPEEDDRPAVLFRGDLEATLDPKARAALLERIRGVADQYIADEKAAADESLR